MPLPLKPYFKAKEAAFEIGCSSRTIQRAITSPEGSRYHLKALKTGNGRNSHYLISRDDLQDYIDRITVGNLKLTA